MSSHVSISHYILLYLAKSRLYLTISPYISLYLPISQYISLYLTISHYISLYFTLSPYISIYLTISQVWQNSWVSLVYLYWYNNNSWLSLIFLYWYYNYRWLSLDYLYWYNNNSWLSLVYLYWYYNYSWYLYLYWGINVEYHGLFKDTQGVIHGIHLHTDGSNWVIWDLAGYNRSLPLLDGRSAPSDVCRS